MSEKYTESDLECKLKIRLLQPEDSIRELTGLLNRAYKQLSDMGLKYVATWQGDDITLKRIKNAECYVGLIDEKLVATILFRQKDQCKGASWYLREDVANFSQFAVEPEMQGRGIGTLMVRHVENRARETGAGELALDTSESATHLIDWYKRMGYRFAEYVDWEMTNYRSVILSKRL